MYNICRNINGECSRIKRCRKIKFSKLLAKKNFDFLRFFSQNIFSVFIHYYFKEDLPLYSRTTNFPHKGKYIHYIIQLFSEKVKTYFSFCFRLSFRGKIPGDLFYPLVISFNIGAKAVKDNFAERFSSAKSTIFSSERHKLL